MSFSTVVCLSVAIALFGGVAAGQCVGRVRSVVPVVAPPCPCNDDLGTLLALARALDGGSSAQVTSKIDVEDIIMKLVNALIYTTTQTGGRGGSIGGVAGVGSGSSLVDLGLLQRNSKGSLDLLDLGLGGTSLLGLGLGGNS